MSTTIYNGYVIKRPLSEIGNFMEELYQAMGEAYQVALTNKVAQIAAELFDVEEYGLTPGEISGLDAKHAATRPHWRLAMRAKTVLNDMHVAIEKTGYRNPRFDLGFDVTILFDKGQTGRFYALITTERDEYRAVWEALRGVEEYRYWNNGDGPDEISGDAWHIREIIWKRLLSGGVVNGLTWNLLKKFTIELSKIDITKVWEAQPSEEDRLARLKRQAAEKLAAEQVREEMGEESVNTNFGAFAMAVMERSSELIKTQQFDVAKPAVILFSDLGDSF